MVGKTASCAAMALTVGVYVWPAYAHEVAVVAVVALTAVNYVGVQKSARLTRVIVVTVLAVLAAVVVAVLGSGAALTRPAALDSSVSAAGCYRRPGCCSSPSPATRGSPPWARRSAIRRGPSPARS